MHSFFIICLDQRVLEPECVSWRGLAWCLLNLLILEVRALRAKKEKRRVTCLRAQRHGAWSWDWNSEQAPDFRWFSSHPAWGSV